MNFREGRAIPELEIDGAVNVSSSGETCRGRWVLLGFFGDG